MVIFNSYVKLPEGINQQGFWTSMRPALQTFMTHERDEFLQKETQIFWGSSSHSHTKKKNRKWRQFQFSDMPLSSIAVQNFANPFHSENPMAINGPFMIHLLELGTQPSLFQIYGILWAMISWWYPFSRHLNVSSHFAGQHLQVLAARPWQTLAFLPRKIPIWWEYEWRILMV